MRIHIKWLALGALVNLLIFLSPLFLSTQLSHELLDRRLTSMIFVYIF